MKTKLLDCTIRDGGYINNWNFTNVFVNNLITTLEKANYDYLEIGYINDDKNKIFGKWRNININTLNLKSNKIKFSIMCNNKEFNKELFNIYNENIALIRLAFHKNEIDDVIKNAVFLKKLGYKISLNAMGTIHYSDLELKKLCEEYIKHDFEYIYIADSYGGMYFDDIKKLQNKICNYTNNNNVKLGFHSHNNLQNGINNVFYCIDNGFDIVDTTVLGIGRGVGNAQTELLLCKLYKIDKKYEVFHIIKFINENMKDFCLEKKKYLPYLICGYFNCHPSYISKIIELNIIDYCTIWNIINKISLSGKSNTFNKNILEDTIKQINL